VLRLTVTLLDIDPPVWRRLLVPATIRLDRLDHVIQAAMRWTNSHLHMFIHHTIRYGIPDGDFPLRDERRATLRDLASREGDTFGYEYDLGDGWEHEIVLEDLVTAEPDGRVPGLCGRWRRVPARGCGGTQGYQELIDSLADPDHPGSHAAVAGHCERLRLRPGPLRSARREPTDRRRCAPSAPGHSGCVARR